MEMKLKQKMINSFQNKKIIKESIVLGIKTFEHRLRLNRLPKDNTKFRSLHGWKFKTWSRTKKTKVMNKNNWFVPKEKDSIETYLNILQKIEVLEKSANQKIAWAKEFSKFLKRQSDSK